MTNSCGGAVPPDPWPAVLFFLSAPALPSLSSVSATRQGSCRDCVRATEGRHWLCNSDSSGANSQNRSPRGQEAIGKHVAFRNCLTPLRVSKADWNVLLRQSTSFKFTRGTSYISVYIKCWVFSIFSSDIQPTEKWKDAKAIIFFFCHDGNVRRRTIMFHRHVLVWLAQ